MVSVRGNRPGLSPEYCVLNTDEVLEVPSVVIAQDRYQSIVVVTFVAKQRVDDRHSRVSIYGSGQRRITALSREHLRA